MGLNISHAVVAGSILIIMALVGCLGGDDGADPAGDGADDEQVEGTGGVEGRVLTVDLDEVADARVSLVAEAELVAQTRSQEDGAYAIRNVEPGDYRLQVTAPCCREFVQGVEVVADETVRVDLQVERFTADDLQQPWVEEYEWTGFLACGVVVVIYATDACSDFDDQSEARTVFEISPGLMTVTAGLHWDSPGLTNDELQFAMLNMCDSCSIPPDTYGTEYGTSPVLLRIDDGGGPQSWAGIEGTTEVQWGVWPPFWNVDLYFQQEFTVYYQLHYHQKAPEGFDPLPDR